VKRPTSRRRPAEQRGRTPPPPAAGSRATAVPVILIEDNHLRRDGLSAVLGAQGLTVIASARSGRETLRQVTHLKPQVVLLDSALGERAGLRVVEELKKVSPAVKVIVMHLPPARGDVAAYVRAGVSGFVLKDASVAEFVATIRSVADGRSVLPPLLTRSLFAYVAAQALNRGRREPKAATRLTAHAREAP
jgi:DNA-binding NarL/FixJ family response regulator